MDIQVSVSGLYFPPLAKYPVPNPPQTIISAPVQTVAWPDRAEGALLP